MADIISITQPTISSSTFMASRKVIVEVMTVSTHSANRAGTLCEIRSRFMLSAMARMGKMVPSVIEVR